VTNPEGTDSLAFDAAGRTLRAVAIRNSVTYRMENQLDAMGDRTQLSAYGPWSGAHVARFHYNADFRLDSIVDFSGRASTLAYNTDGQLQGVAIPGDGISRGYSSVHAPYEIIHDNLGLVGALDISYNHDQNGLIGSRIWNYDDGLTTGQMVRTYTYDRKGQLTQRTARRIPEGSGSCGTGQAVDPNGGACVPSGGFSAPGASWSWDRVGNPTGTGVTVDTGNRLTAHDGYTMEYDADGNMTRRYSGSNDQRLYWSSLGQLDSVTTNGVKVAYGYNGLGQRVRRTQGSTTMRMLYDGDDLLMDLDASGNPLREYTYYPGIDDPHSVYKPGTGGAYYYSSDYPGSVYALTNPSGAVVARYDYGEFGAITVAFDSVTQPLKYMARELDETTGMVYMRARWYHPTLGRFVSEDPIGLAGGFNLFVFASNSPTNLSDPYGLDPTCVYYEKGTRPTAQQVQEVADSHGQKELCEFVRVGGVTGTGRSEPLPPTPRTPTPELGPHSSPGQVSTTPAPRMTCDQAANATAASFLLDALTLSGLKLAWRAAFTRRRMDLSQPTEPLETVLRRRAQARRDVAAGLGTAATSTSVQAYLASQENGPRVRTIPVIGSFDRFFEEIEICIINPD
jgi:RHS repeat-associated protein